MMPVSSRQKPELAIEKSHKTTVLLVEQHAVVRQSLRTILEAEPDFRVVAEANGPQDAGLLVRASRPQAIVVDVGLMTSEMQAVVDAVSDKEWRPRVIAIGTGSEREDVAYAISSGACGYLRTEDAGEELAAAIRMATSNHPFFGSAVDGCLARDRTWGRRENMTVLVVDDDVDFVEVARVALESEGYRVIVAGSKEEGLAYVRSEKPDLIVLDVMMPTGTEGFHFVWELRKDRDERLRRIPILMVTAINDRAPLRIDPDDSDDVFGPREYLPVEDFIEKPVSPVQLCSKVKKLLAQQLVQ